MAPPLRTLALFGAAGIASAFSPVVPSTTANRVTQLYSSVPNDDPMATNAFDELMKESMMGEQASPTAAESTLQPPVPQAAKPTKPKKLSPFEKSMKEWNESYPSFAYYGWGPSVHAEVWNGRHAMFGWFFICVTAYCKGHGLIPEPDKLLDLKQWGTLATISGRYTITNERAIVLIANVHCFFVGLCATIAPQPFIMDPLLLDPNAPGYEYAIERNKKPYGVLPPVKTGLTPEAEIYNGRMAMFGLIMVIGDALITHRTILDVVNDWVGGGLYN
jgi:hypothetical protein